MSSNPPLELTALAGVADKISRLLPADRNLDQWASEFEARIWADDFVYVYTRRGEEDVFWTTLLPANQPSQHDVIFSRRVDGNRITWVIEQVVLRSENKLSQLGTAEILMLRELGKYMDR